MVGCIDTAPLGRAGGLGAAGCGGGAAAWRREYTSSGRGLTGAAAAAAGVEEAACRAAAAPGAAAAACVEGVACRAPDISEGALPGTGVVAVVWTAAPSLTATRGQSVQGADSVLTRGLHGAVQEHQWRYL